MRLGGERVVTESFDAPARLAFYLLRPEKCLQCAPDWLFAAFIGVAYSLLLAFACGSGEAFIYFQL